MYRLGWFQREMAEISESRRELHGGVISVINIIYLVTCSGNKFRITSQKRFKIKTDKFAGRIWVSDRREREKER